MPIPCTNIQGISLQDSLIEIRSRMKCATSLPTQINRIKQQFGNDNRPIHIIAYENYPPLTNLTAIFETLYGYCRPQKQMESIFSVLTGLNIPNVLQQIIASYYTHRIEDRIEKLFFQNNQIERVPPSIKNFKNLTELYLNNNKLKSLPQEFAKLTKLRTINLNCNPSFTQIPPRIASMPRLQTLSIFETNISQKSKEQLKQYLSHMIYHDPDCFFQVTGKPLKALTNKDL